MSCVYCAPKSRIRMRSCEGAAIGVTSSAAPSLDAVVRSLLDDLHVVHVRLADARRRDLDELGARAQLLDRCAPAVTHRSAQAAHQLRDDVDQRALVRDAALDALGHELLGRGDRVLLLELLEIAVGAALL